MKKSTAFFFAIILLGLLGASLSLVIQRSTGDSIKPVKGDSIREVPKANLLFDSMGPASDTTLLINRVKVLIRTPNLVAAKGTFLLLPGWNFPPDDWCLKTAICKKLVDLGYFVVMPDMGKSVYQEQIFPETRADWRHEPTRKWLTDTVIVVLQKQFGLLLPGARNFIVGLSTGARGVALVVLDLPNVFTGAAALSGDYDQTLLPHDRLMTGFYGPYLKFKERWKSTDNVIARINSFQTPLYLGHGTLDKTCTPKQTQMLFDSLRKNHPNLKLRLNMPKAGHDYHYWGSEVMNLMAFFGEIK